MPDKLLEFDDKLLRRGFVDIEKAYGIAAENTLNIMAGLTRKGARKNIDSEFILRNKYTLNAIQFEKASSEKISGLESRAGALKRAGYMALQEEGGERKPSRGDVLAIPTTKGARGGSKTALVSKSMYLSKLRPKIVSGARQTTSGNRKARFYSVLYVAIREKKLINIKDGLYSVTGQIADGKIKNADMELLYSLQRNRVSVKSEPWLDPATIKPIEDSQFIFNGQIFKLLKKDII